MWQIPMYLLSKNVPCQSQGGWEADIVRNVVRVLNKYLDAVLLGELFFLLYLALTLLLRHRLQHWDVYCGGSGHAETGLRKKINPLFFGNLIYDCQNKFYTWSH